MNYKVGFIGWKIAARLGVPLSVTVRIGRDEEAGVWLAQGVHLTNLIVEADTLDNLFKEIHHCAIDLIEIELGIDSAPIPEFLIKDGMAFA